MEGICKTNAKTGSIGEMTALPREEDNMSLYELMLASVNRKTRNKEEKILAGTAFNIKRCNTIRFETIPAEMSIPKILFKGVFWYNPAIQKAMIFKKMVHSELGRKVAVVHNPEDLIELERARKEEEAEKREQMLMWREEVLTRQKISQEKERERVLLLRRRRKEDRARRAAEMDAYLEKLYKKSLRDKIGRCELDKWASRIQYLYWVCKPMLLRRMRAAKSKVRMRKQLFEEMLEKVPRLPPVSVPEPPPKPAFNYFSLLDTSGPDPPPKIEEAMPEPFVEEEAPAKPKKPKKKIVRGGEVTPEILMGKLRYFRGKHEPNISKGVLWEKRRNLGGKGFAGDPETLARFLIEVYGEAVTAATDEWLKETIVYSDYKVDTDELMTKLRLFTG